MTDREHFERIAALTFEPLQRYLGRRCSADDAADVFADTLSVVWRRLAEVPEGAELAWCYGVARRCLANHRRGDRRRGALAVRLSSSPIISVSDDTADQFAERDRVATALSTLGDLDAEIVRLWAWEGLDPREIAVVVDLTANAVSIRLHRAKKHLAERLEPSEIDHGTEARQKRGNAGHTPGIANDDRGKEAP